VGKRNLLKINDDLEHLEGRISTFIEEEKR
jgi:hypothetical protein